MCCSVVHCVTVSCILQCPVAVWFSAWPGVAACYSVLQRLLVRVFTETSRSVLLQHVAACSSMLQHVAACCSMLQHVAACCNVWQCVVVRASMLWCVVAPCIVLHCVAVRVG